MKAVFFNGPGNFEIKDIEIPEINEDEILIRTKYSGLCGTDLKIFKGDYTVNFPVIPGHEFSGVVDRVGKNIKTFKSGDRVAVDQTLSCGVCYYCRSNRRNLCETRGSYGTTKNGGFAEYTKVLEQNLYDLDDSVTLKEAALQEPLGCSISGIQKLKINYGDNAILFGAGTMGLILLQLLNLRGISHLTVIDVDQNKLDRAKKLGADEVILNDDYLENKLNKISRNGFNIVIDATGNITVYEQLFKFVKKGGEILFFGLCASDKRVNISPNQIHRNELSIYGSFSLNNNTTQALEMMKSKKLDLDSLISHEFRLSKFDEAFKILKSGKAIKILIDCT